MLFSHVILALAGLTTAFAFANPDARIQEGNKAFTAGPKMIREAKMHGNKAFTAGPKMAREAKIKGNKAFTSGPKLAREAKIEGNKAFTAGPKRDIDEFHAHHTDHDVSEYPKYANITWTGPPIEDSIAHPLERRSGLGVYSCAGDNWQEPCQWVEADGGLCHPYEYGQYSSFGVDMNLQCAIFRNANCVGGEEFNDMTWPGTTGSNFAKLSYWGAPQSYRCRMCYGCINGNAPYWDDAALS